MAANRIVERSVGRLGWALTTLALFGCGSRTGVDLLAPSGVGSGTTPDGGGPCNGLAPTEHAYVFDTAEVLYRYDPLLHRATALGEPNCGEANNPWTITVSPENAYIVYTDWTIYAVDLTTLACSLTPFQPGQLGIDDEFGVAVTGSGANEKFFVYGLQEGSENPVLAVSDTTSFALTLVGSISPPPPAGTFPVNLTSDEDGYLYAFSPLGVVQKIDPTSGAVLQTVNTGVTSSGTWATLTYGSDLFLWVGSNVEGYDLTATTVTSNFDAGIAAIGAGSFLVCGD